MTIQLMSFIASLFLITPAFAQNAPPLADLSKYDYVDPKREIPTKALEKALTYYDVYYNKISNKNYLTVIDFTQASNNKRMYVVDMKSGAVTRYLVAHGKGSDPSHTGMAKKFSNVEGSNMSSIGMYVTGGEYSGKHGRSMRLVGLEKTNDQAMDRAIVVHGAWYVDPQYKPLGRSQGCPAVEEKYINTLVTQLKGGSVYYIWAGQN
ncbi:murein L,D-transpeptidase catalytic domain family protein [uncultured Bdellovibrio sp.]|uniref:murein L,D-transpeptidase catalytic domain family protein n=1 Tax=Bdellovibrio sp. HCB-162 TaxID=3394234 RepID=UPI0025E97B04|nr:murein L,D-transpeptidase catalytic domain family protein [uncultured Bdellovibrio sp.]